MLKRLEHRDHSQADGLVRERALGVADALHEVLHFRPQGSTFEGCGLQM
jgi:hypothetical protein